MWKTRGIFWSARSNARQKRVERSPTSHQLVFTLAFVLMNPTAGVKTAERGILGQRAKKPEEKKKRKQNRKINMVNTHMAEVEAQRAAAEGQAQK